MNDIIIVIPSYKPDAKQMPKFIKSLHKKFNNIVIVDDGSGSEYEEVFNSIENKNITILKHAINMGKGRALKTAFNHIYTNYPNYIGIITADCDGQHKIKDIIACAKSLRENPNKLILGVRDFNNTDVPTRSRFGNKITRNVFKLFIGLDIKDTQTGLRGISKDLIEIFMSTKGDRYEYETHMLIDCKFYDIEIEEIPISTIYINNNAQSHFNPIKDSIAIYKLFLKYILSSVSSFILDILIFALLMYQGILSNNILINTIIARIISSIYNFFVNGKLVFKKINNKSIFKYIFLVIMQMFISGITVSYINNVMPFLSIILIKIIIDTIIFFLNFIIQREWIFNKNISKNK